MDPSAALSWNNFFEPWDAALGALGRRSIKVVVRRGTSGGPLEGSLARKEGDPYVLVPLGGSLGKPDGVLRLRSLTDAKLVGKGHHPHASNLRPSDAVLYTEIFPILQHLMDSKFGMGLYTETMGAHEFGASSGSATSLPTLHGASPVQTSAFRAFLLTGAVASAGAAHPRKSRQWVQGVYRCWQIPPPPLLADAPSTPTSS